MLVDIKAELDMIYYQETNYVYLSLKYMFTPVIKTTPWRPSFDNVSLFSV